MKWRKIWIVVVMLLSGVAICPGASSNDVSGTVLPQEYSVKCPDKWELPKMSIDPSEEHIYGISFEARGTPGCRVCVEYIKALSSRGIELRGTDYDRLANKYGAGLEVNEDWQTGRAEVLTKRGVAWLAGGMKTSGQGEVRIRNLRLVEGGFPDNPPIMGPPYIHWINSLRTDRAYAGAYTLTNYADVFNVYGDAERWKTETQAFRELPVERLIELMPTRRSIQLNDQYYDFEYARSMYRWDPRRPDVLLNQDGTIFDVEKKYPLSGYEGIAAPSGKIVNYPYHDPPGTNIATADIHGEMALPSAWLIFGPAGSNETVLSKAQLVSCPDEITLANRKLKGRRVNLKANSLDLGALFGGQEAGKTAYMFAEIQSARDQTVTMGAGADWWMQWWVNGQSVYDNTQSPSGNIKFPALITDHCFDISLKKGTNVLVGRIISGSASFTVAVGGPDELRRSAEARKELPTVERPPDRVYLDQFMTRARIGEMMYAAGRLTALYQQTGDRDAALRAATILWALMRNVPDWPLYGTADRKFQFFSPDTCELWFVFIIGYWYQPSLSVFCPTAGMLSILRSAPVWEELAKKCGRADPQADIENGLLHAAKMSLKTDAHFRVDPWRFFHNTIGGQLRAYMGIGRAIGCPELVHYAIQKGVGGFRSTFMVDGMVPESASYIHDMGDGIYGAISRAEGYSDPKDYTSPLDGRHIDNFKLEREVPLLNRFKEVRDRLYFPDGSLLTVHDSWPNTVAPFNPARAIVRERVEPYLIPEFGHAILGHGTKPNWIESHLHYSGCYNHRHMDMLTFTLWAYGDELTADIGYSHIGGYESTTLSHNLVVVDEEVQRAQDSNVPAGYLHRGNLLAWFPNPDAAQVEQAAETNIYSQTQCYRRAIINVPMAPGKDAVVDVFETSGGRRHDWMANGCADYEQTVETTLKDPLKKLPNLAPDGKPVLIDLTKHFEAVPVDSPGKTSHYYGAFTDASVYRNDKPWSLTMKPCPPVPAKTPGAGPRAVVTNEIRPSLRLHWLAPLDGEAILCKAPRQRYFRELEYEEKAQKAWNLNLMPKVIVRRDAGKDMPLASTFVAAWEPFREAPWIEQVSQLPMEESSGTGVRLAGAGCEAIVLYLKPEHKRTTQVVLRPEQQEGWRNLMKGLWGEDAAEFIDTDGRFVILRRSDGKLMLDLYDGTYVRFGPLTARLKPLPPLKLSAIEQTGEECSLVVEGTIPSYPENAASQPHAGQFIKFCQPGQLPRWLPLTRVEKHGEKSKLVLAHEPGFVYDFKRNSLRETYYPFRTLSGPTNQSAVVQLPDWLNVKWESSGKGQKLAVNASGDVMLEFKDTSHAKKAQLNRPDKTSSSLPLQKDKKGQLRLELTSQMLGKGWNEIIIGN